MIKFGIVGLGRIGQVHLQNIQQYIPDAQIVAACSGSEQSLSFFRSLLPLFYRIDSIILSVLPVLI